MRLFFTSLILLFCFPAQSQNLVPDSSFESFTNCPQFMGQIQSPMNPGVFPPTLTDWFSPMSNSPDFFHNCSAPNSSIHVPNNTYHGPIPTHSGDGYVGIVAFGLDALNNTPFMSYREYVECQLIQPMVAGQTYYIAAYVRNIIRTAFMPSGGNFVTLDKLEAHFSPTQTTNVFGAITLPGTALTLPSQGFITDTTWVRIYGEYVATGGEQFMTLGTFNNNSFPATQHAFPPTPSTSPNTQAYYFIDDVSVRTTPFPICDTTKIIHDTTFCTTEPVTLLPSATATSYLWNTGITSPELITNTAGTYYRIAATGCNAVIDTYKVKLFDNIVTTSHNPVLCAGINSINLNSIPGADTYMWNTGANVINISVNHAGIYHCTAVKDCILYTDTFHVTAFQTYTTLYDTAICFPGTLVLAGETNAQSYLWNNGATTYNISVSQPGSYSCEAIKGCDLFISNFNIANRPGLESIDLGQDTVVCNEKKISIGRQYEDATYLWNTGATTFSITPGQPGNYSLQVDDGCKILTDTIAIDMVACEDCIYMPTAFTPNADAKNDELGIKAKCPLLSYDLKIFNRFGELVYETNDISGKWNGIYKGEKADLGVYFYYIEYTSLADRKNHFMKGDVTLLY